MKTIQKLKDNGSKILLGIGALAGAAAIATSGVSAQNQNQNQTGLGAFPEPYVTDGQANTAIVVGEDADPQDREAAQIIADSLPIEEQAQNQTDNGSQQPTAPTTSGVWAASGGTTLDTRNDKIYFGDPIDSVRNVLTQDDLPALEETTFTDAEGDETDITQYLRVGSQNVTFSAAEDDEDPFLYVNNPESVGQNQNLFELQANFGDEINFTSEDVQGEEIEMFGTVFTVSEETTAQELILIGGREELEVETGQSQTFSINGSEYTVESLSVFENQEASIRIDGQIENAEEGDTFNLENGETLRVQRIVRTTSEGEGIIVFSIASQEIALSDGDIEVEGDDLAGAAYSTPGNQQFDNLGSLSLYVGSDDDDTTYVREDGSYAHPFLPEFTFRFGGLSPNSAESAAEQFSVSAAGQDTVEASFNPEDGDNANIGFFHIEDSSAYLADADNNTIATYENQSVPEDAYIPTSAGGFSHLWQVTDTDSDTDTPSQGDEATVELDDQITGTTVEVDLDAAGSIYSGTQIIDGRTYNFYYNPVQDEVSATWDPDGTSIYPALDTQIGSAVAFTDEAQVEFGGGSNTYVLPSTDSSNEAEITLSYNGSWSVDSTSANIDTTTSNGNLVAQVADGKSYIFGPPSNGTSSVAPLTDGSATNSPSTLYIQPENSQEAEETYINSPTVDGDDEVEIDDSAYTGTRETAELESNDDITQGYDRFGGFTEYDSSNEGDFSLSMPEFQAIAGLAFTGQEGQLGTDIQPSTGDGGQTPTQPGQNTSDLIVTADDSNIDQIQQDENLILVGGPAVNSLVRELADQGTTPTDAEYPPNTALLQSVTGAFDNNDALIVAGTKAPDTLEAAEFLANYEENSGQLQGQERLTINTTE